MRIPLPILVTLAALLAAAPAPAQSQDQQAVPDAPQPQKKAVPKAAPAPSSPDKPSAGEASPAPPAKPDANQDENAFPEAASREAAKSSQQEAPPSSHETHPPAAGDNPFPEDVSRDAAKAAAATDDKDDLPTTAPTSVPPPGMSSSQSQGSVTEQDDGPAVADPARAQKDTDVGGFYLKTRNFQGALMRFADASKADPTNVAAIFGMAQAQQSLGKTTEAAKNYQLYLDIVPNGPRSKEAIKALKTLQAKR